MKKSIFSNIKLLLIIKNNKVEINKTYQKQTVDIFAGHPVVFAVATVLSFITVFGGIWLGMFERFA